MTHQPFLHWMHRWSRPLIAGIASLGAVATAYPKIIQLTQRNSTCRPSGCNLPPTPTSADAAILSSPITLLGLIACISMVVFAIAPLLVNSKAHKQFRSPLEKWTIVLLAVGGTLMLIVSSYLLYTTLFEFHEKCSFCIMSTLLSASLFILALSAGGWQKLRQQLLTATMVMIVLILGVLGLYTLGNISRSASEINYTITSSSSEAHMALAEHLQKLEAKMYGAFWCDHCNEQKEMFGQGAWSQVNYIECDAKGKNSRPDLCKAAKIKGFPTWEINGQLYLGKQSLQTLADLSDYKGSQDFQNYSSKAVPEKE
ncbi:MAG: hypothetical protein F6K55_10525 [Moorea sp. SIO4A3]|nr:hypothetical protein [Moorena sp. SIO4A3]